MSSDQRDGRTIRFFSTSVSKLCLSLTLLKHEINKQGFIFEDIRRWPFINLVNLVHEYSYLISLEIFVDYEKL